MSDLPFSGALVVSCQPVDDGPLDRPEIVVAFARAAVAAGAAALRIEGADNVAAVVPAVPVPVIGLIKRDLADSPVRITAFLDDVDALAAAGARIIAVDATRRRRPVPVADLLARIHAHGCLAMADLATEADARAARALGFDILGTTMSGYTGGPVPEAPDLAFVAACRALGGPVIAEGRYNTPPLAAAAIAAGADAVCVGSAITRPEHVTGWFRDAVAAVAARRAKPVLALDIGGTKLAAALVRDGVVLERRQVPTPPQVASGAWFARLADLLVDWRGTYAAAGAAVTGVVVDGLWSALNPAVLPIPDRTPIAARLGDLLDRPVRVTNDAQAAAWGEYRRGAGRGRDMVFVTVSTGIGGGAVLGGRLVTGARGLAGSLGQMTTASGAPLEACASGTALAAAAAALGHPADTRHLFAAAAAGEAWATAIVVAAASAVAAGLVDLQRLFDPEVIVVGGGIGLLDAFRDPVAARLADVDARLRPAVVPAALGADAGLVGIADLALAAA
jgi:N-acetylmannosamine-6-phosphate 2-epimerase/N-acetylmannosamine kinase